MESTRAFRSNATFFHRFPDVDAARWSTILGIILAFAVGFGVFSLVLVFCRLRGGGHRAQRERRSPLIRPAVASLFDCFFPVYSAIRIQVDQGAPGRFVNHGCWRQDGARATAKTQGEISACVFF